MYKQNLKKFTVDSVQEKLQTMRVYESEIFDSYKNPIPGFKGIFNETTNLPVGIFSTRYKITQHEDAFKSIINEIKDYMGEPKILSFKPIQKKKRNAFKATVAIPGLEDGYDVDGSLIIPTFEIYNSTDGTLAFTFDFGAWRQICENGLMMFENKERFFKKRHTTTFNMEDIDFDKLIESHEKLKEIISKSQEVQISKEIEKLAIESGFSKKIVENLPYYFEKYAEAKNEQIKDYTKVWALYAVLSNYISNVIERKNIVQAQIMHKRLANLVQTAVK